MNKNKLIVILIYPLIILSFTSCYEECPAFPEGLIPYFPYTNGQMVKFKNNKNDTISYKVGGYYTSESYSRYIFSKSNCLADLGFSLTKDNYYHINCMLMNSDKTTLMTMEFFTISGRDYFEEKVIGVNPYLKKNNLLLGETFTITKDNPYRISSVTIVRGKGIVEFTDIEQNCTWKLIE